MAANPGTNKGISVSFNNTPQAKDDFFSAATDDLSEDNLAGRTPIIFDVMANDAGGNGKSLYSIDDGINSAGANGDLLQRDVAGAANHSLHGATIKITADGKIFYDASTLEASFVADLQRLAAGEFATDSFTYAIQLGNGTLSWATATVQIAGVNDAPIVAGSVVGIATEDGPAVALDALANAADTDHGAVLSVTHVQSQLPAGVSYNAATQSFTLDPANAAYQHLAQNEQTTVTVNYDVTDGLATAAASVSWIVSGINDAPVVSGAVIGAAGEDGAAMALDALANASDIDDGAVLQVTNVPASLLAGVTYSAATHGFTLDPANAAYQYLAQNEQTTVTVNYDVTDGLVTTAASATWTVTGANDAPTLQSAVPSGDPVFDKINFTLTLSATMAFDDVDLLDTHTVTVAALTNGSIGTFTPTISIDSTSSGHGVIGLNYHLTKAEVDAVNGHFPGQQDYLVTVDDHHGGTSSQTVSIPLAQILSGVGGGDGGDGGGHTVQPPVFTIFSPPALFVPGQNQGQITDNPFVLHPSFIPPGGFSTDLFTQGTLNFIDPDGGNHHVSVDLSHAFIGGYSFHGASQSSAPISASAGTWQVNVQEPGQVHWTYTLNESVIRPLTSGEIESIVVPVTIFEDGVGHSTTNVRINLVGADEPTSLVTPSTAFTATTDITPYLLPIDLATHVQTQNVSITEDPLVTGSTSHHTLHGTIYFVDPDRLDNPTVTMTVANMTHDLHLNPGDGPFNAAVQPLMAGFSYTVEQFGNYGMIHWTYDVLDSALDFLAQATADTPDNAVQGTVQTASASFSVGGSLSTVNVELRGSNDAVVAQGPDFTVVTVTAGASASTGFTIPDATGGFTITDADWYPDGHSVEFVPHNPSLHGFMYGGTPVEAGRGGSETISWNYIAGPDTLLPGQDDVWDVVVRDHFGSMATHTLDFHLV